MKREAVTAIARLMAAAAVLLMSASCVHLHEPEDLNAYLQDRMERAGIPGMAVGVVSDGELVYSGAFGYCDIASGLPVTAETVFMIASVSKTVTASALMLLESRGELDLDDDINEYAPFRIANPRHPDLPITFRMLLTHTSSIEDTWEIYDSLYTIDSGGGDSPVALDRLIQGYFIPGGEFNSETNFSRHEPGARHSYSNMGYSLIGYLVQEISGRSFDEFCRENLFEPLGMDRTAWFIADLDPDEVAVPHRVDGDGPVPIGHYGFASYPDGQLRTTVPDFARFVRMHLGQPGPIPQTTIDEILRIQEPSVHRWQAIAWNYNELDSMIVSLHLPHVPAHTGGDPGVATGVMIDPGTSSAVIVFANGFRPDYRAAKSFYLDILKRLALEAGML